MNLKGLDLLCSAQADYVFIPIKSDYTISWDSSQHKLSYDQKAYFVL